MRQSRRGQQGATYQQRWRKNTKLATAKLWTVRPLSTAKRGTGSYGGLPRQFVLATTARSRGTLWGDHRSDLQFGRAMVGGDLGRGICTSPGQGAFKSTHGWPVSNLLERNMLARRPT